jgi:hypothetical protein
MQISEIKMADIPDVDLSTLGITKYGNFSVEVVDPVSDYLELMEVRNKNMNVHLWMIIHLDFVSVMYGLFCRMYLILSSSKVSFLGLISGTFIHCQVTLPFFLSWSFMHMIMKMKKILYSFWLSNVMYIPPSINLWMN